MTVLEKNKDKAMEVRSVRNDMRSFATLYGYFKRFKTLYGYFKGLKPPVQRYGHSLDMFNKGNFDVLKSAIDKYCEDDGELKAGLKVSLKFLINTAAKLMEGLLFNEEQDHKASVKSSFLSVFKLWDRICLEKRTKNLTEIGNVKTESQTICHYKRISLNLETTPKQSLVKVHTLIDTKQYILLRYVVCARLTLFNARLGGEAARWLLSEFKESERNELLDPQQIESLDVLDKAFVLNHKIGYLMGKGNNKMVSLLITKDSWDALKMLTDLLTRESVGITSTNPYVFAHVKS